MLNKKLGTISSEEIQLLFSRNNPKLTKKLAKSCVAIAGCGGLGSNAAIALVRNGLQNIILADFDKVELSNLNRQYYFLSDIGQDKTQALKIHITAINPQVNIVVHNTKLCAGDIPVLFSKADILIEAFDNAESKKWLIESWCKKFPHRPIICGSGISGYGKTQELKMRKSGNLYFCGDFYSDPQEGLSASRVAIVANMQANIAIELLAGTKENNNDNS